MSAPTTQHDVARLERELADARTTLAELDRSPDDVDAGRVRALQQRATGLERELEALRQQHPELTFATSSTAPAELSPPSVEVHAEEVFGAARRADMVEAVFALRERWVSRAPGFYTLGMAVYQDADDRGGMNGDVAANNALIERHFGEALQDLRASLATYLDARVDWAPRLPLPGFHIFDAQAIKVDEPTGGSHFDIQFVRVGFGEPVRDVMSITVPIQVPEAGTSLEYWDVDHQRATELIDSGEMTDLAEVERSFPRRVAVYEPGKACIQRGLPMHRVGPSPSLLPSDHRITLQCHAVLISDRWLVYW